MRMSFVVDIDIKDNLFHVINIIIRGTDTATVVPDVVDTNPLQRY